MITRTLRSLALFAAVAALGACNGDSGSEYDAPAPASNPTTTPAPSGGAATSAPQTNAAAASQPASDPAAGLTDDTAEGALEIFMVRIKAGDLEGALEVSQEGSKGAQKLASILNGLKQASADGSSMNLAAMMVASLKDMQWMIMDETEESAVGHVAVPGKDTQEINLVKTDEGWRVIPPDGGLPGS